MSKYPHGWPGGRQKNIHRCIPLSLLMRCPRPSRYWDLLRLVGTPTWLPCWRLFAPIGSNVVDAYLAGQAYDPSKRLITICDWGCCNGSAIDCSTAEGNIIFMRDKRVNVDEEISFFQWMKDWANGIDLWKRTYGES